MTHVIFLLLLSCTQLEAYSNQLYTIGRDNHPVQVTRCDGIDDRRYADAEYTDDEVTVEDPIKALQMDLHSFLYGSAHVKDFKFQLERCVKKYLSTCSVEKCLDRLKDGQQTVSDAVKLGDKVNVPDVYYQYVMGNAFRSDLYMNKTAVHLVPEEFVHKGHCLLNVTQDYMQTAVNAFAIFLYGNKEDVERLPAKYVLDSSRAISMLNVEREKLRATWKVIKENKETFDITYETLEKYRPLFKYVSGKEMSRLNLMDERILRFIGTHPSLNRHQVGVVASHYTRLIRKWNESTFLNKMNNLLCGVPITYMRRVPPNSYLQLPHEAFYHTRACDRLQKRFYLAMMTKTLALGKSYSWNSQDVSRLGLLLTEVDDKDLAAINPKAMAGISPQVMDLMPPDKLKYLTELQLRYLGKKALNILIKKLKKYKDEQMLSGCSRQQHAVLVPYVIIKLYLNNYI